MVTRNEIVYMVLDIMGVNTQDTNLQKEHVAWLVDRARDTVLNMALSNGVDAAIAAANSDGGNTSGKNLINPIASSDVSSEAYQSIFVPLAIDDTFEEPFSDKHRLISTITIPNIVSYIGAEIDDVIVDGNKHTIMPMIERPLMVNNKSFEYAGTNRYLTHQLYATIVQQNNKLYVKAGDNEYLYIQGVYLRAIFSKPDDAYPLTDDGSKTDALAFDDSPYPIQPELVMPVVQTAVKSAMLISLRQRDTKNDDLDPADVMPQQKQQDNSSNNTNGLP